MSLNSCPGLGRFAQSVIRLPQFLCFGLVCLALNGAARADILPPGNRAIPPGVHALVGGKVVVKPGQVLDSATVLIRDGLIEAVGANVITPADARVWDMKGLTIYAGFIDPYLSLGSNSPGGLPGDRGPELRARSE